MLHVPAQHEHVLAGRDAGADSHRQSRERGDVPVDRSLARAHPPILPSRRGSTQIGGTPGTAEDMGDRLRTYRDKRRGSVTTEPGVREQTAPAGPGRDDDAPRFVIQKHDATTLHYDFRLEVDGTLRSWAVPKGPSTDPRQKRLAVEVEDHPLEYADFEGVIGAGYGSGAVIVWDAGTYRNLDETRSMAEALEAGHAKVWLEGEKLTGGWTLHRTGAGGAKAQWLLIKRRDEGADARRNPQKTQPESVRSGRTVEEVAAKGARDPDGDRS